MKKLTRKTIAQELLKLSANYPNQKSNDDLQVLASLWLEDFSHIAEEIFLEAIRLHRQRSRFFPVIAEILELYAEVVRNIPKPVALPEPEIKFTPEEEAERQELIRKYKKRRRKIGAI